MQGMAGLADPSLLAAPATALLARSRARAQDFVQILWQSARDVAVAQALGSGTDV